MKNKLRKSIFIATLTIIGWNNSISAQAPTLQWVKSFGSTQADQGNSIVVDGNDNVFVTGNFSGQVDFDPNAGVMNLSSIGSADAFIIKMNNLGDLLWAKNIGGDLTCKGNSITTDISGNIFITGVFQGTVDFDPGASINNMTSLVPAGFTSIFILKLNNSGNFVWAKQFEGNYSSTGISTDNIGNVYISGAYSGTVDFDPGTGVYNLTSLGSPGLQDGFILKLDGLGSFVWAKSLGGSSSNDWCLAIDVDVNNNVYTSGLFWGTSDFDPGTGISNLTSLGQSDIFISKLDGAGNFIWAKSMGSSTQDESYAIKVDLTGNVYTTGSFQGTVDFDPGAGSSFLSSNGLADIFVQKLNSLGNLIWAKQLGSSMYDFGYSLALDTSGDIFITGNFQETVDFDPNMGANILTSTAGQDVFVLKLDANGNHAWAKSFGNSSYSIANSLDVDSEGSVYSIGSFEGTMDFDPSPAVYNINSSGSLDIFIHKLDMVAPEEYCDFTYSINDMVVNFSSSNPNCTSFIWDFGNGNTSTINPEPIVTYVTTGIYSPCFQCNTPASCLSCLTISVPGNGSGGTTGIENIQKESGITIYPNPSTEFIMIETENTILNSKYVILNSIGQQVLSGQLIENMNTIDIRHLSVGFYIIQIESNSGRISKTIIKN